MKAGKREIQRRIAYEAARILTDYRSDDLIFAINKAATKLGVHNRRLMPNHEEVDSALREQQRLFRGTEQQSAVKNMRNAALPAMKALKQYKPLLIGPVYEGTADLNSRIRLFLFAPTPEDVALSLLALHIPWHEKDCSIKFTDGSRKIMPSYHFTADGNYFELIVLPDTGFNKRPLDPQEHRPIKGLTVQQLEKLLSHAD
ncbi:MAG: hypothetical protein QNJ78_02050 [Gammaproteobacteria bacterium]|nr:hypothetical protein [Gammaproteobacteria bacterium]